MANMLPLLLISQFLLVTAEKMSFKFTVYGIVKCRGTPVEANILMIDDNFAFTDHLLTERSVGQDGKFRLTGVPDDDSLDVLLIVEHKCHDMKYGRHDRQKLRAYSEFKVPLCDLKESRWNLEMNIDLSNNKVRMSSPVIPAWKALLYGKRMVSDTISRLRNLNIWKLL